MSTAQDVLKILQSYVKKSRAASVSFPDLLSFTRRYLDHFAQNAPDLKDLDENTDNLLAARLIDLEKQGKCKLQYDNGSISGVLFPDYYVMVVQSAYRRIDERPELPFPTEESLKIEPPGDTVHPVDVKIDFISWLSREETESADLLRLMYPEGIRTMIVTSDLLPKTLADLSLHKIRNYLRSEKNASYMRTKLGAIFRNRDLALKEMLDKIMTNPNEVLKTILTPSEFTFHFWTTLSSIIIKDNSQKKDKLQEEHDYCQAAYLLGYYSVYYKGIVQKQRDVEAALKTLDYTLKKEPYVFTASDIYNFTDNKGVLLTKKYNTQDVNAYLAAKLKPPDEHTLPELLRFKTAEGKEYYIRKEFLLKYLLEGLRQISEEFKDHYVEFWSESLKQDQKLKPMTDDDGFYAEVAERFRTEEPILAALLNYNVLYLTAREQRPSGPAADDLGQVLDTRKQKIRPIHEILELERKTLYNDARLLLPFWQAIPLLNAFVRFFKRAFLGVPKKKKRRTPLKTKKRAKQEADGSEEESASNDAFRDTAAIQFGSSPAAASAGTSPASTTSSDTRKARAIEFRNAIHALQEQYVGENGDVNRTLEELAERWNPLLDPVAKNNLVEDVNSLVRDFLRRMKVGFRLIPPDRARIRNLAEKLAQNDAFDQIRRKDPLKEYLELYMLKVLGK